MKGNLYKSLTNTGRNKLNKSNSIGNIFPQSTSKKIYKINDRLYSPNTLSLLTKNDLNVNSNFHNFKSNYNIMIHNLLSNDVDLNDEKKLGIESLDSLLTNVQYLKNKNNFFEQKIIEEKKKEKKENKIPRISSYRKQKIKPKIFVKKNYLSEKKEERTRKIIARGKDLLSDDKKDEVLNLRLVNQVLKFNKTIKKEKNIKDKLPMKLDKHYDEFIQRKILLNYNPNFNSPIIRRISINFIINDITKNFLRRNTLIENKRKINEERKKEKKKLDLELSEEMRDSIEEMSVDLEKKKKNVRIFLTDETKLNQVADIKEDFFDTLENKINYILDCRRFPVIKNNLNRIKIEIRAGNNINEWTKLNTLGNCTLNYLNKLKYKLQKELDEIEEKGNTEKEKRFRLYKDLGIFEEKNQKKGKNNKKLKKENEFDIDNNTSIDYIIEIMKNEIKNEKEETEESFNKEKIKKEDNYELEEFFVNKSNPYKQIDYADKKLSYVVYHNQEFNFININNYSSEKIHNKRKNTADVFI